jgi:AraC family transcriptional regulator, positive regulator of tynA and feaB
MQGQIEIVTWSTESVDSAHHVDYYADALNDAVTPMGMKAPRKQDFHSTMTLADAGLVSVLRQGGSAHRVYRDHRHIERTEERSYHLVLALHGTENIEQRERVQLRQGDALLIDSALPVDLDIPTDYECAHLKLSEKWMRQWVPSPGVLTSRRICGSDGWGRALVTYAAQLSPQTIAAAPLPLSTMMDHLGALFAIMADEAAGSSGKGVSRVARALAREVGDCIVQRCVESGLTAAQVALAVGVSPRTLHRCLAAQWTTFGALLIGARADRGIDTLRSPLGKRLTIAEAGRRAGFADASHFVRAVRNRTGCTPSQVRDGGGALVGEES